MSAPRTRNTADLVISIIVILIVVCAAPVLMLLGGFSTMASDMCVSHPCNDSMMNAGAMIAIFATPVVAFLGIVVTVVMLVLKRLGSFWALGTLGLVIATAVGGVALVTASVG